MRHVFLHFYYNGKYSSIMLVSERENMIFMEPKNNNNNNDNKKD